LRIGIGRFTSPAEVDLAAAALGAAWRLPRIDSAQAEAVARRSRA
jgi:hypothetical protein